MDDPIEIVEHRDNLLPTLTEVLDDHFPMADHSYSSMEIHQYREIVRAAQDDLNALNASELIAKMMLKELLSFLKAEQILIQTNIYLRAARPHFSSEEESIGWHRESFYGSNMSNAANIWTPLRGVCRENTLRYVPGSAGIPDNDLITESTRSVHTEQFSSGHKIGFLYAPKKITQGVDFNHNSPLDVPLGSTAIFSGNLIHGAATNRSHRIRFSIDFRAISVADYSPKNKQYHFASGQTYFREIV
jgi:ectoine hydroxylase-related dioxygenase (phytanoyl-CoA dioxygenase family)